MNRRWVALCVLTLVFTGCQDPSRETLESVQRISSQEGERNGEATVSSTDDLSSDSSESERPLASTSLAAEEEAAAAPITKADLDAYKARFDNPPPWTYGERVPGELAGVWVSDDPEGKPIEFDVDGVPGTFAEDFVGNRAIGLYAIASDGKIVTASQFGGASLGSHFNFNGQTITGPRGPNPMVTWHRQR